MFVKMEDEDYFASTAYSRSILHAMLKSPKLARHLRDTPCKSNRSLRMGSALHCAVLEPNTFSQRYCVIEGNRNATRVKEAIAEAELNGFTVLKDDEMESTMRMCEAIVASHRADGGQMAQYDIPLKSILIRISTDTHASIKSAAALDKKTLEQWCVEALENAVVKTEKRYVRQNGS